MATSSDTSHHFCPLVLYHDDPTGRFVVPEQPQYRIMIDSHRIKTEEMLEHNAQVWCSAHLEKGGHDVNDDINVSPSTSTSSSSSASSVDSNTDHASVLQSHQPLPSLIHNTITPRMNVLDLLSPNHFTPLSSSSKLPYDPIIKNPMTAPDAIKKRRRGNLPKEVTEFLKEWLVNHKKHPYPSEKEKAQLAARTSLTVNQISNWFINARRRILQPMLESESMNAHSMAYSEMVAIEQKKRRQLDIYAYQGFAEAYNDDSRKWAFRRTKLPAFDAVESSQYPFDVR